MSDADRTSVVSLEDISVHFEQESSFFSNWFSEQEPVRAVDDVNLDIYENDVIAFVGESGCGKTTLGKVAVGLQRPTAGYVRYRGQDIWEAKEGQGEIKYDQIRNALQIIHQDPGSSINPNRQIIKSLETPIQEREPGLSKADRQSRIYGMLESVGMTPAESYAHRYPHQLSGGEQQRIALIRSLLMNPDLILADEAVSALDVSLRVEMMDLMLDLQDQFDTSYLFISHNLSNARYITERAGGRIGVMYLGKIVEIGTAEQILSNPQHPYTKVLRWATPKLTAEGRRAVEPPIRAVDIPDPSDPPAGCSFHTRCPEAREVCQEETPDLVKTVEGKDQRAACFRAQDDHPYWDSEPLPGVEETAEPTT